MGKRRIALYHAFHTSLPIMAGYRFLGLTYGIYMHELGFNFLYPMLLAITVYAGSAEFLLGNMLLGSFHPLQAFLMVLMVNAHGELVGINAMLYSQTGSFSGYGFAIPTAIMNKVVADLKKFGTVQRALLGISGTDVSNYIDKQKDKGKNPDLGTVNGIYVAEVSADGAAAEGGLKEGDVIISVDGKKISKFGELQELLTNHRPGDKITVTYLREKKQRTATLTLRNIQGTTTAGQALDTDAMGAALRPLTNDEKQELNLSYGLMISAIREGKLKAAGMTKGLIIMKVNDREMRTTTDFDEAVKAANLSTDRVLWIRAKTQTGINKSFAVELSDPKASKDSKKDNKKK